MTTAMATSVAAAARVHPSVWSATGRARAAKTAAIPLIYTAMNTAVRLIPTTRTTIGRSACKVEPIGWARYTSQTEANTNAQRRRAG
jgi:hypothetical protein